MRFEELAYTVDGLAVTVAFDPGLTAVHVPVDESAGWVARLLGVLGGFRDGDGARLVCIDSAGQRIGLERDEHGAATLTDLDSGEELRYSAAHLSLDGRFDWFASIGITAHTAVDLMAVDRAVFAERGDLDTDAVTAELHETRRLRARVARQHKAATARSRHVDELHRRIAGLDEGIRLAGSWQRAAVAVDDARRTFGPGPGLDPAALARALARPAAVPPTLESLTAACRATALRRDELVSRLDRLPRTGGDERGAVLDELSTEVEPALVDALAALAEACRPFDVVLDAARLDATGVGGAGIDAVCAGVVAEIAARAAEADCARRQQTLEDAVSQCRAARQDLGRHLGEVAFPADGSDDPADELVTERARLVGELERSIWDLPDADLLAGRRSTLDRQIAALEASLRTGRRRPTIAEVEAILVARAAGSHQVGRHREPLPLVINAALGPTGFNGTQPLLAVVSRLAETSQVVLLTDDPDTLALLSNRARRGRPAPPPLDGIATVA